MAIAGRVAIVPKGEWSQSVTYDKLDLVTYNGNTFIAYKSSVGVEPVDGDTWMLVMQGIDPQDIENIIDGTTPVGDSNKLGGKGASEYVSDKGGTISSYLNFKSVENGRTAMIKSHSATSDSGFLIQDVNANNEFINFYVSANDGLKVRYKNNTTGQVLSSVNVGEYALPKTGGEVISNSMDGVITFNDPSHDVVRIAFKNRNGHCGWLAQGATDGAFRRITPDGSYKTILDTGNKPIGTYTGNGSATSRTIATGGIGNKAIISCADLFAIVYNEGAIGFNTSTGAMEYFVSSEAKIRNGNIGIGTTSTWFNASGKQYTYDLF